MSAAVLACRVQGTRRVGPVALLVAFLLAAQFDPTLALAPVAGLVVGFQLERGASYGQAIAAVALPGLVQGLYLLWDAHDGSGSRQEMVDQLVAQLEAMGLEMAGEERSLRELADTGLRLRPGTEFVSLMWMAILGYRLSLLGGRYLPVTVPQPQPPPLALWRPWPELIWALIGGLALLMVGGGFWQDLGLNVLVASLIVYAVHGVAVFRFFARRFGVPWILEGVAYGVMVTMAGLSVLVLVVMGLMDTWFDWRGLSKPSDRPPEDGDAVA